MSVVGHNPDHIDNCRYCGERHELFSQYRKCIDSHITCEFSGERCTLTRRVQTTGVTYDVEYGDAGYEREPGTSYESRESAMDDVATAIAELQEILALLSKEPRDV